MAIVKIVLSGLCFSVFLSFDKLHEQYNVTPAVWSALKEHRPYTWAISGFHRCVNESFALLGCYAALFGSYRRFGTTDRSHLQVFSWTALLYRMGPMGCSETSVSNYQSAPRNIPGERRPRACGFKINARPASLQKCARITPRHPCSADSLITFVYRLSIILGASNSLSRKGLSRLV